MGRLWMSFAMLVCAWAVAQTITSTPAQAQLDPLFYSETCPQVLPIVAAHLLSAIQNDSRIAASFVRLHFHDCFVQGCDASVLLDGDGTEKTTAPNNNSLRGYDIVDNIKAALEDACPGVVSCADVLALGSFFGIIFSGGPIWVIPLGREDALQPNDTLWQTNLAPPFATLNGDTTVTPNIPSLLGIWSRQDFGVLELVSLSGAHTIGDVRCVTLQDPNNSTSRNPELNATRAAFFADLCVNVSSNDSANQLATGMDVNTPTVFDNSYYLQFLDSDEAFNSDLALLNSTNTSDLVTTYQNNQSQFFVDFAASMIKMGNLNASASAAGDGEVRLNCSVVNSASSNLRMAGQQQGRREKREKLRKVPRALTEEEEEKYKQDIRDIVNMVADDFMNDYLSKKPVATDRLYSSS